MSALTALFATIARSKPNYSPAMQRLVIDQRNLTTLLALSTDQVQHDYYISELGRVDQEIAALEAEEARQELGQ